jgi:hypothetical protein
MNRICAAVVVGALALATVCWPVAAQAAPRPAFNMQAQFQMQQHLQQQRALQQALLQQQAQQRALLSRQPLPRQQVVTPFSPVPRQPTTPRNLVPTRTAPVNRQPYLPRDQVNRSAPVQRPQQQQVQRLRLINLQQRQLTQTQQALIQRSATSQRTQTQRNVTSTQRGADYTPRRIVAARFNVPPDT